MAALIAAGFAMLAYGTDMQVASLPGLARHFDVSVSRAQLTLSVFLFAFAIAQLVYGPLSDRFGRRPTLLAGNLVFLAASIACALAPSIEFLLVARFAQAIGACAWAVVGRAIVRDVHGARGTARALGLIAAGQSMLIVLAPVIGGVVEQALGWRANYALLGVLGALLGLAALLLLEESNTASDHHAAGARELLASYRTLLGHRLFWGYSLCNALSFAGVMAFHSGASFVLIGLYGASPREFGVLFSGSILGYLIGSFVTARWVMRVGAPRLLAAGVTLGALAGVALAVLAFARVHSVAAIIAPYFVFMVSLGLSQPSAMAGAITPFARFAGTASALYGFVQLAAGSLSGFAVGAFHDGSPLPLALGIGVPCAAAFLAWLGLIRSAPRDASPLRDGTGHTERVLSSHHPAGRGDGDSPRRPSV